jgi:cell shape-determining protein MreD
VGEIEIKIKIKIHAHHGISESVILSIFSLSFYKIILEYYIGLSRTRVSINNTVHALLSTLLSTVLLLTVFCLLAFVHFSLWGKKDLETYGTWMTSP